MSARLFVVLFVVLFALAVVGCETADECKVHFDFEGKTHVAEWWEPHHEEPIAVALTGKDDACEKACAEIAPGDKASTCETACGDAPMGCQTKTRYGF
jgi:hypothetical protein